MDVQRLSSPLAFSDCVDVLTWLRDQGLEPERVRIYKRAHGDRGYVVRIRRERNGAEEVLDRKPAR